MSAGTGTTTCMRRGGTGRPGGALLLIASGLALLGLAPLGWYVLGAVLLGVGVFLLSTVRLRGVLRIVIAALLALALVVVLVRIPGLIEDAALDRGRVWQAATPLDRADHPNLDVPVVAEGQYLIPAGADLSVVDAQTGEEVARPSTGLDDVRQAAFGAGGTYYVTGTDGRTPQAWRVDAGGATKLQDAAAEDHSLVVVGAEDGVAAVRDCPPGTDTLDPLDCTVTGYDVSGRPVWQRTYGVALRFSVLEHPVPRLAYLATEGTLDPVAVDPRNGEVVRSAAGSEDPEDFLGDALPVPEESTTLPEGEAVDVGGLAVTRDGAELTARRGDDVVWTARLAGDVDAGVRAVTAHGELVVSAGARGWGPYRSWRHPGSRQLTVLSMSTGQVLGTPRVASAEVMHPVGGGAVLVLTSDGADGRTQLVR